MKKVYPDADAALDGLLKDGMHIAAGGFGLSGIPELLIDALVRSEGTAALPGSVDATLAEAAARLQESREAEERQRVQEAERLKEQERQQERLREREARDHDRDGGLTH